MNNIQIGKEFEEKAIPILIKEGFKIIEHSSKIEWQSPYDFIVKKGCKNFYVEVRGRKKGTINYFTLTKNKLRRLTGLDKEVLLLCINDFEHVLFNLKNIDHYKKVIKIGDKYIYVIEGSKKNKRKNGLKLKVGEVKFIKYLKIRGMKIPLYARGVLRAQYIKNCPFCEKAGLSLDKCEIKGNSPDQVEYALGVHIKQKHKK